LRWLAALAVSAAAALPAISAAPAAARDAAGHMTGNLNMTLDDTSGSCDSSDEAYGVHFTGTGQIDDSYLPNPDGTFSDPDSSVLNLNGTWNNTFCPSSTYGGSATGTVTGYSLDTSDGTVVDWNYDVVHPGMIALTMAFHGDGQANDPDGTCGGSGPTGADIITGINFPAPAGGFGSVHIDKSLTYGSNGSDIYEDHWVGGADGCGRSSTDGTVVHVTGDLTISQPPSTGGGSGAGGGGGTGGGASGAGGSGAHAAGSAKGGSGKVGSNGSAAVGSVTCAGPGSCSASTTVTGSGAAKSAKKKKSKTVTYGHARTTIAAGKKKTISVKLSKKALKALKKSGRLKSKVTIVVTSAGDKKVTKHFSLTLKRAKAKKKH
jgi:hypothetical protein